MQPRAKPSFEWQEPTGESQRKLAPLDTSRSLPELPEPRTATKGSWLFALVALGALAYLILTGDLSTILIIAAILGVLFSLLVAWGIWIMNNVHF